MWPENPPEVVELVTVEDDTVLTTPCFAMKAQGIFIIIYYNPENHSLLC